MMSLEYYIYYLYYSYLGFPLVIRIAIFTVILLIPLYFITMLWLIKTWREHKRNRRKRIAIDTRYLDKTREILVSKTNTSPSDLDAQFDKKIQKLTKREKKRITNMILDIIRTEKYINKKNNRILVEYIGLREFWESRLKRGSISFRHKALTTLNRLNLEIPGSSIASLAYHKDKHLRKKARASYIYFSKNDPFRFFNESFDKTFNNWDKIEIHNILVKLHKEGEKIPNLIQWIKNSNNIDFQDFLIREIGFFKQYSAGPFLFEIFKTDNKQLRESCIASFGDLKYSEVEDTLISDYSLQPNSTQQAIITAIGKFDTGNALPFLTHAYDNALNHESRILILNTIYNYKEEGKMKFDEIKESSEGFINTMCLHISNPLLAIS